MRYSRAASYLRTRTPILFFLCALITGQILAHLINRWSIPSILGICLFRLTRFSRASVLAYLSIALPMLLGTISMLKKLPTHPAIGWSEKRSFVGTIDEVPRHRRIGQSELSIRVSGEARNESIIRLPGHPSRLSCKAVYLPWRNISKATIGSVIAFRAKINPIRLSTNPFDYNMTLARHGYSATCTISYASILRQGRPTILERIRRAFRQTAIKVLGNNESSGLVLSMSIGTRDVISQRTEDAFKRTGLAPLLVVSGYQVTLVYYLALFMLRTLFRHSKKLCVIFPIRSITSVLAIIPTILFVLVVGVEGSSLRAGLACVFTAVSASLERGGGLLNSILVSLLFISLIWPCAYFEPAVQLSYAALFGIWLGSIYPTFGIVRRYVAISLCATLCTSLIVACWFEQFSLVGFILNPTVAPIIGAVSCKVGGLALILSHFGIYGGDHILRGLATFQIMFRDAVLWMSDLPFAAISTESVPKWLIVGGLGIGVIVVISKVLHSFGVNLSFAGDNIKNREGDPSLHSLRTFAREDNLF